MQKKLLTLALVSSLFAVGATAVQAAEMKIGVVNTEVILALTSCWLLGQQESHEE